MTTVSPARTANLYDILAERGLVAQTTDTPDRLRERLTPPTTAYCGFDPTADSLHVGSLVPIMALAWLQRCGHKPLVLVGGATALVGDPSGKTEARQMLDRPRIDANAAAIAEQIGRFLAFGDGESDAELVDNADWLAGLSWIDLLRDVGSRVSVNRMLSMESVKGRIDSAQGISYLEFSYMIMQAYDFAHLHRERGCTLQLGGQDQWGNIVMGLELGRKMDDADLAGLTLPLVTKSDGAKFGKSEAGNVWLDPRRTPPYDFYQFWRNTADADVGRFLGYFTFLEMDEVRRLGALEGAEINAAKESLAYEATKLVHGEAEADAARDAARKAFGAGDVSGAGVPMVRVRHGVTTVSEALVAVGFAASKGEAKRLVAGGGVRVNDAKVADAQSPIEPGTLRAGKRKIARVESDADP